ncbi:class I SAM-dependent methyltransferase [Sulfuricurvum sp.]|uniref:class I SAM-dependent methyltransferase n=1 Tax=Sulfuricurvum sp. TaxID=2025608 RepID=UPI002612DC2A|nr:class I SAM-dependent methyltransferase [Sulfuricurvum sp.]MDD3598361.1 class I SAM-dependent methyltransferase [Sulfuricurvum sp.]
MTNHKLYSTLEFDSWSKREGLLAQESYFLKKYITDPTLSILEAGTGGGRISHALERTGCNDLHAFDYVAEMIEAAKIKHPESLINFFVADAVDLNSISSDKFDRLIYLQQIISFIPRKETEKALKEAYRILKSEGIAIFSFLNWHGRKINPLLSLGINIIRRLRNEPYQKQALPWLKINNRPNWKLSDKNQPLTYWFEKNEIQNLLETIGFTLIEIKMSSDFVRSRSDGMLYIVCRKEAL